MLLKSSHATSSSCRLYLITSFNTFGSTYNHQTNINSNIFLLLIFLGNKLFLFFFTKHHCSKKTMVFCGKKIVGINPIFFHQSPILLHRSGQDRTGQDKTRHDITGQYRTGCTMFDMYWTWTKTDVNGAKDVNTLLTCIHCHMVSITS